MEKHHIGINVVLDDEKMPEHIEWSATDNNEGTYTQAKAFIMSFWDGKEKTALRMDLWTRKMMVDEMNDFFFETLMTMADTYNRATKNEELSNELKAFADNFKRKADLKILQENAKKEE